MNREITENVRPVSAKVFLDFPRLEKNDDFFSRRRFLDLIQKLRPSALFGRIKIKYKVIPSACERLADLPIDSFPVHDKTGIGEII